MATHCETGGCDNSDCEKCNMPDRRGNDDLPICPMADCGRVLELKTDNVGWDGWEGPRKDESWYECSVHGDVMPKEENENDAE